MNTVILIPARYQSSRYPGKPLVELKGCGGAAKPLIQRSVEAARRVAGVSGVFVVTDDDRIGDACGKFGVGVIMTSPECRNGTERCAEAPRGFPTVRPSPYHTLLTLPTKRKPPLRVRRLRGRLRPVPVGRIGGSGHPARNAMDQVPVVMSTAANMASPNASRS